MKICNPILKGFHPDPSIVRDENDYYIATSTFEWWPGVKLSHSKDLVHWETLGYALDDPEILDLRGVGASQGIWAPCLTLDKGVWYLVFTVVRSFYCNMYDTANYLVTATDIRGPWSKPIPLNNFGFDPSLFHDEDGKKYMVSMVTDHRIPKKYAGRIIIQEYDPVKQQMTGEVHEIYKGEKIFLEGPHLYKRKGYYYLFAADTGTGEGHGQSVLRAKKIFGHYEMYHPNYSGRQDECEAWSIMTTRRTPEYPLQKCGHADLVETADHRWYAVHLCGRPLENRNPENASRFPGQRRYPLGRETAIQEVCWSDDGWPELVNGSDLPDLVTDVPDIGVDYQSEKIYMAISSGRDWFDHGILSPEYQSLRVPMDGYHLSFKERPGWLRMYGREGLSSKFHQTLIARRWTEFSFSVSTCMEYEPDYFKQMAGLICLYDTDNYIYLHVTKDEDLGTIIHVLRAENKNYSYPFTPVQVGINKRFWLRAVVSRDRLKLFYSVDGENSYQQIGADMDCSFLSDEACIEGWFTGSMAGICVQDLTGFGKPADFQYFEYQVSEDREE